MQYMIQLSNGQQFGPADVPLLCQWAKERRVPKSAMLVPTDGGEAVSVLKFPEVAAILEPSHPPIVAGEIPPMQTVSSAPGLIPYRNGAALAAYYLAVFSLIPAAGIVLGALAFVLGIIGVKACKRRPEIHGAVHAWIGIIGGGGIALAQCLIFIAISIAAASSI